MMQPVACQRPRYCGLPASCTVIRPRTMSRGYVADMPTTPAAARQPPRQGRGARPEIGEGWGDKLGAERAQPAAMQRHGRTVPAQAGPGQQEEQAGVAEEGSSAAQAKRREEVCGTCHAPAPADSRSSGVSCPSPPLSIKWWLILRLSCS